MVYCYRKECKYYKDVMCCLDAIDINYDGTCDDFEHFRNAPEYKQKYWIAKINIKTGKQTKALRYGKKVIIDGIDFYTHDDTRLSDKMICLIHARTGRAVGTMDYVKENIVTIKELTKTYINVEDLPESEEKRLL